MSMTVNAQNERRFIKMEPEKTPKRRISDTFLNKLRWPAFVYSWFVLGAIAMAFIIYSVMAD